MTTSLLIFGPRGGHLEGKSSNFHQGCRHGLAGELSGVRRAGYNPAVLFLGEDLLAWLVLALGGALAAGTLLALVRPPARRPDGDLERPPLARSMVMIAIGGLGALWALASLVAG